mgnify:CR=1 FL=1
MAVVPFKVLVLEAVKDYNARPVAVVLRGEGFDVVGRNELATDAAKHL